MVKLSDNVDEDENEPEVLLMGAHHGNEKASYEVLIYFIQHIVGNYTKKNYDNDGDGLINEDPNDGIDNDEDGLIDEDFSEDRIRDVTNNTEIYIIPMVNPDGVEAGTRKNRAPNYGPFGFKKEITSYGVDLNRNYDYRWFFLYLFPNYYKGATDIIDDRELYRGEKPFCEAETKTIKQFVEAHDIVISLSYHSYGELILYPWGYTKLPPKDKQLFVSIGKEIKKINNYTLGQCVYLYPTIGGSDDWLYGEKGIIPYTIELGTIHAPIEPEVVREMCVTHVGVNLYVCEIAESI
jgi:carboxypeptidase T